MYIHLPLWLCALVNAGSHGGHERASKIRGLCELPHGSARNQTQVLCTSVTLPNYWTIPLVPRLGLYYNILHVFVINCSLSQPPPLATLFVAGPLHAHAQQYPFCFHVIIACFYLLFPYLHFRCSFGFYLAFFF